MTTQSDGGATEAIKTGYMDADDDPPTVHIELLESPTECDKVSNHTAPLDAQHSTGLLENCTAPQLPKPLDPYMCGSCGRQFNGFYAFVDLHSHVQTHNQGGSYYYDHQSRTAYPKYDSVYSETQTDTFTTELNVPRANVATGRGPLQEDTNKLRSGKRKDDRKRVLRKRKHNDTIRSQAPDTDALITKRKRGTRNGRSRNLHKKENHSAVIDAERNVKDNVTVNTSNDDSCRDWTAAEEHVSNGSEGESDMGLDFDNLERDSFAPEVGPDKQSGSVVEDTNTSHPNVAEACPVKLKTENCDINTHQSELGTNSQPEPNLGSVCEFVSNADSTGMHTCPVCKCLPSSDNTSLHMSPMCKCEPKSNSAGPPATIDDTNVKDTASACRRTPSKVVDKTCNIKPQKEEKKTLKTLMRSKQDQKHKKVHRTKNVKSVTKRKPLRHHKGRGKRRKQLYTRKEAPNAKTERSVSDNDNHDLKVVEKLNKCTCYKCRLVFKNPHGFLLHRKKHRGKLICDCCNNHFQTIDELHKHLYEEGKQRKVGIKIFVCSFCGLTMTGLRSLVAHICASAEEDGSQKYVFRMFTDKMVDTTTDICEVVAIDDNISPVKIEARVQCETCHLGFENESFLAMHSVVHSYTFKCSYCRLHFMSDAERGHHQRHASCTRTAFRCKLCGERFTDRHTLYEHKKTQHQLSLGTATFRCKFCGELFTDKHTFQEHEETKHQTNHVTCDKCGKSMKSLGGLRCHLTRFCTGVKDENFTCKICYKTLGNKHTLQRHIEGVHHDARPVICEVCGTGCRSKQALKDHMITHQKDRQPSNCTICGASMSKTSLARHMKLHTQGPRFTCETCGKHFSDSWNMKAHLRQHTGEKPYKCGKCGEGFAHNVSRKNHMKKCYRVVADR